MERLAEEYPEVVKYRERLALICNNLGKTHDLGKKPSRRKEKEELVRKAIEIRERLTAEFPTVPKYAANLATSCTSLAVLLDERQDFQAAEQWYRRAIDCSNKLTVAYPTVPEYLYRSLSARHDLAICLTETGRRGRGRNRNIARY